MIEPQLRREIEHWKRQLSRIEEIAFPKPETGDKLLRQALNDLDLKLTSLMLDIGKVLFNDDLEQVGHKTAKPATTSHA